jgi:DNA-binding CsgD family transcriptional regulator
VTDQFQPLTGCGVLPPRDDIEQRESRNNTAGGSGGIETKPKGSDNRRKVAGRFAVFNRFVDFTLADLSLRETKVWLILYRDARNDIARTSQADIARRAGISDRTVRRAITQLESRGLLKAVHRGGLNRGCSSYRVAALVNNSTADRTVSGSTGQNDTKAADIAVSDIP